MDGIVTLPNNFRVRVYPKRTDSVTYKKTHTNENSHHLLSAYVYQVLF